VIGLLTEALLLAALSEPMVDRDPITVATVLYTGWDNPDLRLGCAGEALCEVEMLVRRAHAKGAQLIVVSEYAFDEHDPEPDPDVGTVPNDDERAPILTRFGKLAWELEAYVFVPLETRRGRDVYGTLVAFDPSGTIVDTHRKFELYDVETEDLSPGTGVSAFDTPYGRVGMLLCSDIYGDPRLHAELTRDLGAKIIVLSSLWSVAGANRWQSAFARDWGVHLIAANGAGGKGIGAGVYDPNGNAIAFDDSGYDGFMLATW
jgi:predicted amidohydrolase